VLFAPFPKFHIDALLLILVLVRFTTKGGQEAKVSLAINVLFAPFICIKFVFIMEYCCGGELLEYVVKK
jgi:hypothetical protein